MKSERISDEGIGDNVCVSLNQTHDGGLILDALTVYRNALSTQGILEGTSVGGIHGPGANGVGRQVLRIENMIAILRNPEPLPTEVAPTLDPPLTD